MGRGGTRRARGREGRAGLGVLLSNCYPSVGSWPRRARLFGVVRPHKLVPDICHRPPSCPSRVRVASSVALRHLEARRGGSYAYRPIHTRPRGWVGAPPRPIHLTMRPPTSLWSCAGSRAPRHARRHCRLPLIRPANMPRKHLKFTPNTLSFTCDRLPSITVIVQRPRFDVSGRLAQVSRLYLYTTPVIRRASQV